MSSPKFNRRQALAGGAAAPSFNVLGLRPNQESGQGPVSSWYAVEEFGAHGDGKQDDTRAFEEALARLPSGATIVLTGGKSYRVARSLVFLRSIQIVGSTRNLTKILFDTGSYARLGDVRAAMIFPHEVTLSGKGNSERSHLGKFTLEWIGESSDSICGLLIATPIYCQELSVRGFPGDGFHVEASSRSIAGNANGCSFINCEANQNSRSGFSFIGNDANACVLVGSRAFDNGAHGFHDTSLIGNTYLSAEVAGNRGLGFNTKERLTNSSLFVGCFVEVGQAIALNNKNLMLAPLGSHEGLSGASIATNSSGHLQIRNGLIVSEKRNLQAKDEDHGTRSTTLSPSGLTISVDEGKNLQIAQILSSNYIDILQGPTPVLRFPVGAIDKNIVKSRPWLPNGATFGSSGKSAIVGAGKAPPPCKDFASGAIWLNDSPKSGDYIGWCRIDNGHLCEWRPFGLIH